MSTSKAFAYNPSLNPIDGTESFDSLVVGVDNLDFSQNPGGIKWWGGPDEDLAYVIASARPGGKPVPAGVSGGPAYVGFWKSKELTSQSFLNMANYIAAQNGEPPFATTDDAVIWLNNNGFYTSYDGTPMSPYYIGGGFTAFDQVLANNIILLNSGGTQNTAFNFGSGFDYSNILSIEIDSNGKILAGGSFTTLSGSPQNRLIRFNSNGSKDETFDIGSGFDGDTMAIATQTDGKILVGGWFSTFTGTPQNYLIRLNSDGSKDETFDIGSGFNSGVNSISVQTDGKILVGGEFSSFSGESQSNLIRLNSDGSKDATFDIGGGFGASVKSIAIQTDGKILVGGEFTYFTGESQNYLIRLNSDGSKDATFDIGSGFDGGVRSIATQTDGKVLVCGLFTTFNGSSQNRLIRLNSDGSKDGTFDIGSGFDLDTYAISIQTNGKILVGGTFTTFNGSSQNKLIRLNSDGSKDGTFDIAAGFVGYNSVTSIKIYSNGNIFAAGSFVTYGGIFSNFMLKFNDDFVTINENFNIGSGFDASTSEVSIQTDGKILVGGFFTAFNGSSQNRLIRLNSDGSKDGTFDIGSGFGGGSVNSIATQTDGKILVGGQFTTFNGSSQRSLIRLNSDGSKDSTFNIGTGFSYIYGAMISDIKIQSDGKILVGGQFTTFNGSSEKDLIRLNSDGTKDSTFNVGSGFTGQYDSVSSIEIQSDGKILVGGYFGTFNGSSQNNLIRLNSDGSKDLTFNIGTGFDSAIYDIEIQSDGKIMVCGGFITFNGSSQNRLIRLNSDGSKDGTFDIGSGFDGGPSALKTLSNGKIFVGGQYNLYNSSLCGGIVLLNNDGSIYGIPTIIDSNVTTIGG